MSHAYALAPTLAEFTAASENDAEWLVDGLVPDRGLTVFAGDPRSFKTMAALHLTLVVASGSLFMGRHVSRVGSVLYVSEEGSRRKLANRYRRLLETFADLPAERIRVLHRVGTSLDERNSGWQAARATLAEMEGPVLVVLDTLASLMVGDENKAEDMSRALNVIQRLISDFGVTVVLLHHLSKHSEGRIGQRMRGSSALWGQSDAVIGFYRTVLEGLPLDDGYLDVESKDGEAERLPFRWDPESFLLRAEERLTATPEAVTAITERLYTSLGHPLSARELRAEFPGYSDRRFREILDRTVADGLLLATGATRGRRYTPPNLPPNPRTTAPDGTAESTAESGFWSAE